MALPVDVNTFKHTDPGAPVLNGVAGSIAALLRACLQNGYNVQSPTSVVVSAGVATATYASAHGYSTNRVILVAGAGTSAVNGKKRVISITTNALTFDAEGVADGAVAGTITTKMAPLGFTEIFTGTNLAAFKSDDTAGLSRSVLRIDDTATTYARVISYESMADINTGTGPMPTATQLSGGAYIVKSTTANATDRPWILVGDGRLFYLWTYPGTSTGRKTLFCWGEAISLRASDAFATVVAGFNSSATGTAYYDIGLSAPGDTGSTLTASSLMGNISTSIATVLTQRGVDQLSPSVLTSAFSVVAVAAGGSKPMSGASTAINTSAYPSEVCGGFILFQVGFHKHRQAVPSEMRGWFPGLFHSAHNLAVMEMSEVSGVASAPGRVFIVVPVTDGSNLTDGRVALDMIGPWR